MRPTVRIEVSNGARVTATVLSPSRLCLRASRVTVARPSGPRGSDPPSAVFPPAVAAGPGNESSIGTSFMPQIGQSPGASFTISGCIGHCHLWAFFADGVAAEDDAGGEDLLPQPMARPSSTATQAKAEAARRFLRRWWTASAGCGRMLAWEGASARLGDVLSKFIFFLSYIPAVAAGADDALLDPADERSSAASLRSASARRKPESRPAAARRSW